jgi:hypothetical protein
MYLVTKHKVASFIKETRIILGNAGIEKKHLKFKIDFHSQIGNRVH